MSILSSLYDIRKINNGFLWSTMFVLTSIPIINLYDKKTIYDILYKNDYLNYIENKKNFYTKLTLALAITGFIVGYNKGQPKLLL